MTNIKLLLKKKIYVFLYTIPWLNNLILHLKDWYIAREKPSFPWNEQDFSRTIIVASIFPFSESRQRPQQMAISLGEEYPESLIIAYEGDIGNWQPRIRYIAKNIIATNSLGLVKKHIINAPIILISSVFQWYRWIEKILPIQKFYFDYIDNLELYSQRLLRDMRDNIQIPDKVFVSGKKLEDQIRSFGRKENLYYIPNGVRYQDWQSKPGKSPFQGNWDRIIGYYGMIEEWIDFDMLERAVEKYPKYLFVFIGRDHQNLLMKYKLLGYPNVLYLGYMPYTQLSQYSKHFDIAIIPFQVNVMTDAVSPVKFFEYLAQGLTVVSTNFYEMKQFSDVAYITDGADEFISALALPKKDPMTSKEFSQRYTWDKLVYNLT